MIYISKKKTVIIIAMCSVESFLFGNIIYGFNSLSPSFKFIGVFSELCQPLLHLNKISNITYKPRIGPQTCSAQDQYYGKAFISWLIIQSFASIIIGFVLDNFGLRLTKVLAAFIFPMGCFLFSLTTFNSWMLFPAGMLSAISGYCLHPIMVNLSELFPKYRNLFLSILSGLRSISSTVFSFLKILFDAGIPLWISFICFGIFGFLFMITTSIFIMKKSVKMMGSNQNQNKEQNKIGKEISFPESQNEKLINLEIKQKDESRFSEIKEESDPSKSFQEIILKQRSIFIAESYPNIWKALLCRRFLLNMLFYTFINNRFVFFLSQMGSQLNYLFPNDVDIVNHLQFFSSFFASFGSLISIPAGIFLDKIQIRTNKNVSKIAKTKGIEQVSRSLDRVYVPGLMICALSSFLGSILIGIANVQVYYIIFTLFFISKSFTTPTLGSFILKSFPKRYCGTLIGVTFTVNGIMNFTLFPLLHYSESDRYPKLINYIMIFYPIISLVHPLALMIL